MLHDLFYVNHLREREEYSVSLYSFLLSAFSSDFAFSSCMSLLRSLFIYSFLPQWQQEMSLLGIDLRLDLSRFDDRDFYFSFDSHYKRIRMRGIASSYFFIQESACNLTHGYNHVESQAAKRNYECLPTI